MAKSNNPNLPQRVWAENIPEAIGQARRLAILRTEPTVIGEMTRLTPECIAHIVAEQKRVRNKRLKELQAHGADNLMEQIVDLQMASEERCRELETHKQYDPLMSIRLQQVEANIQKDIVEKILLPRFERPEDEDEDPAADLDARDAEVEAQIANPDAEDISFEDDDDGNPEDP